MDIRKRLTNERVLVCVCAIALSSACGPSVEDGPVSTGGAPASSDQSGGGGSAASGGVGQGASTGGSSLAVGGTASGGFPAGTGGDQTGGGETGGASTGGASTGGVGGMEASDLARIGAFCDRYCAAFESVAECAPYPECTEQCDEYWPNYYEECPAEVMTAIACTETTPGSLEWSCEDGMVLAVDDSCNSLTDAIEECL